MFWAQLVFWARLLGLLLLSWAIVIALFLVAWGGLCLLDVVSC